MAVFIELVTSPLEQTFKQVGRGMQGNKNTSHRAGRTTARRPTRGLEVKDDTYATLKVIKSDGTSIPLVDGGSDGGSNTEGYTNFLLQAVSESRMEKHQIIETFGASYVFFFGESPRFLDVTAQLLNSHDFNWEAEWWANYNMYLRGTKLVEMGARCYLSYDDNIVEGYLMQAQATKSSDAHLLAQLQFRFFVTNCYNVSHLGDAQFPLRASVQLPSNVSLTSGDAGQQIISNLQGSPLSQALSQAVDTEGQRTADMIAASVTGASRSLSQLVRSMPPSFAVSADWWSVIESTGTDIRALATRAGQPIRSAIIDNRDEYVGTPGNGFGVANYVGAVAAAQDPTLRDDYVPSPSLPPPLDNPARTRQESDDLFRQATEFLACYGADINSPAAYASLGIQANFSAGASAGASFSPSVGSSFGFSAGSGVGLGAVAGGSVSSGVNLGASSSAFSDISESEEFQADSLSVIYGRQSTKDIRFSTKRQKILEVGFDYSYGYESDYSTGPGFGKSGFGDYGGGGFGSGNSRGDPGFKNPDNFTFAGVADEESAFERFTRPRKDRTALTSGAIVGRGELSGGASVAVSGRVSAFALVSVEGSLDVTGGALTSARASSDRFIQGKFGIGLDNPFGVNCAAPSGTGIGIGVGIDVSVSANVSVEASASASLSLG